MGSRNILRRPRVAGYLYPSDPAQLRQTIARLMGEPRGSAVARVVMVPHSSYDFSGAIAGATLSPLQIPARWIIVGTNHTGVGPSWSLMADGTYQTPLGDVPVDNVLAETLLRQCPVLDADPSAHWGEHAIEVELPLLQARRPADLHIVPIITKSEDPAACRQVAGAIAEVMRSNAQPIALLISSDLSHDEPREVIIEKDAGLLEAIRALDADQFTSRARARSARLCGSGAIACGLWVARFLGARQGRVVRYGTSAEAGGDPDSAIGFAGVLLNYATQLPP